jgi:hypothetical protein
MDLGLHRGRCKPARLAKSGVASGKGFERSFLGEPALSRGAKTRRAKPLAAREGSALGAALSLSFRRITQVQREI